MIILINSSKTMVSAPGVNLRQVPVFLDQAQTLDRLLKQQSLADLKSLMHISPNLAAATHDLIARWNTKPNEQTQALDAFQGDIYRGLVAKTLGEDERAWANDHLRILSGLYGILRPFDRIMPYRLELYYGLSGDGFRNLYEFWGSGPAETLPKRGPIFDLASEEYSRLVRAHIDDRRVIEPEFLTRATTQVEPTFVAVHAKVARGTMARWMVQNRVQTEMELRAFPGMGYVYVPERSTAHRPTFVRVGAWTASMAKDQE
jgi:cytoplasmic iron level regulating protein YaaA (DUF328/UPF0246 family)